MRLIFRSPLLCVAALWLLGTHPAQSAPKPPNIIFVLTDDQGYGDLGAHGNPVLKTPHLDQLHADSARFTDFRVSPTCAPTRASLLTGRHEFRSGVTHTILERERLSLKSTTLAQVLRSAGYTTGIFGKWHLGDEAAYQPNQRGFDEVFIHGGGGIGQKFPGSCADAPENSYFDPVILHNGRFEKTKGYCTEVFFRQALSWIEEKRTQEKPFFVWLATNAPHAPLHCPPEWSEPYEGKVGSGKKAADIAKFFGMIAHIDAQMGKLLERLKALDLERDTLVVFMNDNGGTVGVPLFNAGMFGSKVTAHNGGTRAISLWRWPGHIPPGDRPQLTAHLDFFPTLAEIAGATVPEAVRTPLEGFSLLPLLQNPKAPWPHQDRVLVTHVGRWKQGTEPTKYANDHVSVRSGKHLLIRRNDAWALYDLSADPAQTRDLAASEPGTVAALSSAYDAWWEKTLPCLENENGHLTAPAIPPFFELYQAQFGSLPNPGQ
jgi:arylsulfatase